MFEILLGIFIAVLLDKYLGSWLRTIVLGGILLPHVMTPVVGALIFSWLFRDPWGLYAAILNSLGLRVAWYANPWAARFLVLIYEIWQNTPLVILIIFAGLQALPQDPLEAARIDGASEWQVFRHITIPFLRPLITFAVLVRTMDAYRVFDSVYVMTGGGPGSSTETIAFYNYIVAFRQLDIGKGAAISVFITLIALATLGPFVYRTYKEILER
ncbi:MAG: sugar ABC transporter permease [Candidatus Hadarchaeum sp.]|uniref:carbohydrate ABC transporter permease n=1 Tax=Candidatus Hadarchaeum sp. TaxID=2883567 RepID=UPI00316C3284